jgi:hypothetical protein
MSKKPAGVNRRARCHRLGRLLFSCLLEEAAGYIMKLPKAKQKLEEWQTATEMLIMAAEGRRPLMHARIGVLRARKWSRVKAFGSGRGSKLL